MARLLPNVGTVSYNGFTFPAPFEADVEGVPLRDTAGRYIKLTKYTITIRTLIVPDDAPVSTTGTIVDENLEDIRCKLEKAGGSFIFVGQGFGREFVINSHANYTSPATGGGTSTHVSLRIDPTYGPFPTIIAWKPAGSNRACYVTWSVEVTIPECCDAGETTGLNQFIEHNYSITWSINQSGATERVVNGYYEVPGYRYGAASGLLIGASHRIALTADTVWDRVFASFPQVPGFSRRNSRSLAADKRRMNYTITDTEVASDNPYYPFMVKMDISHTIAGQYPKLFEVINQMSGTIEIAPGVPRQWAFFAFNRVFFNRYGRTNFPYVSRSERTESSVSRRSFKIPLSYSFTEHIYARSFDFSVAWRVVGENSLEKAFEHSGLFTPILGIAKNIGAATWPAWTTSMARLANASRGLALLKHLASDDNLIFSCDSSNIAPAITNNLVRKAFTFIPESLSDSVDQLGKERPHTSYNIEFSGNVRTQVVTHLPTGETNSKSGNMSRDFNRSGTSVEGLDLKRLLESPATQEKIVQTLGPESTKVTLSGRGTRVAAPVVIPKVTKIGDVDATVTDIRFVAGVVGKLFSGLPVFGASWEIDFDLAKTPSGDIMLKSDTDAWSNNRV